MFGRKKRFERDPEATQHEHQHGGVATAERHDAPAAHDGNGHREAPPREHAPAPAADERAHSERAHTPPREAVHEMRARQRAEFGGFNWGSAFFGWLVAIGLAALLTATVSAAGAAVGLSEGSAETIGIVGGILLLLVLMLAYYSGGYVAGRMSRFDGARQGFGVWVFGLLATIVIGAVGAIAGSEYNVLERLDLPRIPIDEGALTTGGIIALAAIVLGTLLAAIAGGKVGQRYHHRVDRAGIVDPRERASA